jgi:hypothetical protein
MEEIEEPQEGEAIEGLPSYMNMERLRKDAEELHIEVYWNGNPSNPRFEARQWCAATGLWMDIDISKRNSQTPWRAYAAAIGYI